MNKFFIRFGQYLINPDYIIHISLIELRGKAGIEVQCTNEYYTKYYDDVCDRNQEFNNLMDILCNKQ